MEDQHHFKEDVVNHRIPLHTLPRETVLSVLNKMDYKSFINAQTSTKWLHTFTEENRKYIHLNVSIHRVSIRHSGIFYGDLLKMPLPEIRVLRPREVFLGGLKFKKIPRLVKVLHNLGWLSDSKFTLCGLEEKTTLRFMDEIYYGQYSFKHLRIDRDGFAISNNILKHSLLSSLHSIDLSGTPFPDMDFILGSQRAIKMTCQELPQTAIINRLMHSVYNGSSNVESFYIRYIRYRQDPIDEILAGIPYKLLWSRSTHEQSIFTHRRLHPTNFRCSISNFWIVSMNNGKVLGIQTFYTDRKSGLFQFLLFNSEEELIVELEERPFRPR